MNVNGSSFHMLLGLRDWGGCRSDRPDPVPLAEAWASGEPDSGIPWYDKVGGQLALLALDQQIEPTPGERRFTAEDCRAAAADRHGNLYVISDDGLGLLVRSAGDGRVTRFWPPSPTRRRVGRSEFADVAPVSGEAVALAGLAVTPGDFLVAGFADSKQAGLLRFDLVGGGAPERIILPAGSAAASLARSRDGGLWLLDSETPRLLKLDRDLRLEARPVPDQPPVFAPEDSEPAEAMRAEPIAIGIAAASNPVAIVTLEDDSVILLDAPAGAPAALFIVDPGASILTSLAPLDFEATCLTAVEKDGVPALMIADAGGNQARRVQLVVHNARWRAEPRPDTLPLRRFGGRALVTIQGTAHYDSGESDPIWVPVVQLRHRRFASEARFVTRIYDGAEPQCVWDRLRLDGCIMAGTSVTIEARAADDEATLRSAHSSAWIAQPALLLSATGSELPAKRSNAVLDTDPATGKGTWELLLQNVAGRYAQLRVTLKGDGRSTPRLRALRLWYPRFSYVERFLPGVYREDPVSASFLERFLANFEGMNTRIEDRIAGIEALFDPRTAPEGMLDWLASWFDVALDRAWDERRRRLFIAHAVRFFGWRGTIRGIQLALKLALDPAVAAEDFDLEAPRREDPRSIRIVEAYVGRAPGRVFAPAGPAAGPGMHSLAGDWTPEEGEAGLWARWPGPSAPGGRFPLVPPAGQEAAWTALVERQFGFVPVTGRSERERWQAFRTTTGWAGLPEDLPDLPSDEWRRYAALHSRDRRAWHDFLRSRYRTAALMDSAHGTSWGDFALVPLPDYLPATPAATRDWLMFEGQALPIAGAAHRFAVLLPRTRVDSDPDEEARRLELARRIVGLEKPAHTVFEIRFYWAMNRVGEARLGLDSAIGQGSRAPELVPGAVLGRAYVGAAFVGGPDPVRNGRERIAC
jgi:phage tail-like protein